MALRQHNIGPHHLREIKEHLPVGDYFTINPDGQSIVLHDIVTHEPLLGAETPPGMTAETNLEHGLDFLQAQGRTRALSVQLVLAPHGSAEDFARIRCEHESALIDAPVIALEMTSLGHKPQLSSNPGRKAFQQAELDWAQSAGKIILPCELAIDDDSILATNLSYLWNNVYEATLQNKALSPEIRDTAAFIAEAAYQRSRQPAILARMGYLLSSLVEQQAMPSAKLKIPLVLGSWHGNSKSRLDDLGVPNEVLETAPSAAHDKEAWDSFGKIIMNMTYTSHATLDDLSIVPPYYT